MPRSPMPTGSRPKYEAVELMTKIIDGTRLAASIREDASQAAGALAARGCPPSLRWLSPSRTSRRRGMCVRSPEPPGRPVSLATSSMSAHSKHRGVRSALLTVSQDPDVHGIILQTPLPAHADLDALREAIDPAKDVDGANPVSLGRLVANVLCFRAGHGTRGDGLAGVPRNFATRQERGRRGPIDRRGSPHRAPAHARRCDRNGLPSADDRPRSSTHPLRRDRGRRGRHSRPHHGASISLRVPLLSTSAPQRLRMAVCSATWTPRASRDAPGALTPVPGGVGPVTTSLLLQHTVQSASTQYDRLRTQPRPNSPPTHHTVSRHRCSGGASLPILVSTLCVRFTHPHLSCLVSSFSLSYPFWKGPTCLQRKRKPSNPLPDSQADSAQDEPGLVAESVEPADPPPELSPVQPHGRGVQLRRGVQETRPGCPEEGHRSR